MGTRALLLWRSLLGRAMDRDRDVARHSLGRGASGILQGPREGHAAPSEKAGTIPRGCDRLAETRRVRNSRPGEKGDMFQVVGTAHAKYLVTRESMCLGH